MKSSPDLLETPECLCLASRRAARAITRKFDAALRPLGLRATQFTLLATLALKGPQSIGALAEFIGVERTTLTRNLAVAEKQSLVSILPGRDARSHIASVTAVGRRTLSRALAAWRATQGDVAETMGLAAADSLRRISHGRSVRNADTESMR